MGTHVGISNDKYEKFNLSSLSWYFPFCTKEILFFQINYKELQSLINPPPTQSIELKKWLKNQINLKKTLRIKSDIWANRKTNYLRLLYFGT